MCGMSPLSTAPIPQKSLENLLGTGALNSDTQASVPTTQSMFINPILKCAEHFLMEDTRI